MAGFPSQEHRPLKKPRLGTVGPDVYLQDKKQKEDEMTQQSVKQGFSNQCPIKDEYGSAKDYILNPAKDYIVNPSKIAGAFSAILGKKHELSTFQDQSKKKLVINTKDNFWMAGVPRIKPSLETWFKDLAGTKPLTVLAKKVPVFNKKEEIFQRLFDDNVPITRAAWFIKMTNAYHTAVSEGNKAKKRQALDPFLDWTQALTKYLREQLQKILEHYQGSSSGSSVAAAQSGFLTVAPTTVIDVTEPTRQWNYVSQLGQHMYSEGLLDRHEFLSWIVELLEKVKITDDNVLKLVMAQVLKYMTEFTQSQTLSRRLAHFCCKKMSQICSDASACPAPSPTSGSQSSAATSATTPNDAVASSGSTAAAAGGEVASASSAATNTVFSLFGELCNCPQHRSLLLSLSSVIQAIVLSCPSALVWHHLGDGKLGSPLSGSPLDHLPCSPSQLPMPNGSENKMLREQLQSAEEQIVLRSIAVEMHWSSDKRQQSTKGQVICHMLNCLETIDKQNFDKVDTSNSIEQILKLFAGRANNKDDSEDEAVVNLLLEWAVSTKRTGEHRAIVVAKLLEKYQNDMLSEKSGEGDGSDDRESTASEAVSNSAPIFQNLLMQFLDSKAPVLEDNSTVDNQQAFANLVLLFTELIRHDIFSHDLYVCTLISRGDIHSSNNINVFQQPTMSSVNPYHSELSSIKSEGIKQENHEDMKMELDCQQFDAELGFLGFKEEPKSSPDRPASVMSSSMEHSAMGMTPGHSQVPTPSGYHGQPNARTPGAPVTPMSARTPGPPHTPGMAHTPGNVMTPGSVTPGGSSFHASGGAGHSVGMVHTPASVLPAACGGTVAFSSADRALNIGHSIGKPRHLVFLTHFPIPVDDQLCSHEHNQRMVVLYGVGRQRDEARHNVKKVTKEVCKLLGKKNSVDLSGGDSNIKTKKKKEKDVGDPVSSLDNMFSKFRKLSYYDQHIVTQTACKALVEAISTFAAAGVGYLPQIENVSFLFDLMEYCLNISRLLELAIQLLRDLPEIATQLHLKTGGGKMAVTYSTGLGLCIVGILRKYQACLLLSQEQTVVAFDSLCKVVKHVSQPSDCSSAERAMLAYLHDLYMLCAPLRSRFAESFGGPYAKVKSTIYAEIKPSSSNLRWEEHFAKDLMENPKAKIDPAFVKQLNDTPANRYSFVCSALVNICCCQSIQNDRLNDISILCAELTACCNALSAEWLGVMKAFCWSSDHDCGFIDVLTQVDVDFSIHDTLAVFTAIMIARQCFTLENLVRNVALQSLLAACPAVGSGGDLDAENGARLTCHLLLRLFQMMSAVPSCSADAKRGTVFVRSLCDRHLLEAARNRISVGAVVAVLKALLMLGDGSSSEMKDRSSSLHKMDSELDVMSLLGNLDDDCDLGVGRLGSRSKGHMESAGLSEYAKHCLREICSQEWVREKFLKENDQLFTTDLLLDKMITHRQAEQLVQMICYPGGLPSVMAYDDDDDDEPVQRHHVSRILNNLDLWSQRVSWLEIQLMIKQASLSEMSSLLDNVAKATIDVFQQHAVVKQEQGVINTYSHTLSGTNTGRKGSEWLVAPLISKLSSTVQGRILKHVGQVLETSNSFWSAKNSKERERYLQKSTQLLGNQPFLSLVLTCLRGQDEQRECLLKSLHDQLEKFVTNAKEQQDRCLITDENLLYMMQEALQLRLSLIGNMFDTIQRNNNLTQEWATLLIQLISSGVVDMQSNSELFTIMIDMLGVLIHGTLASDNSDKDDKKVYQSLIRKLKKEIGERKSPSVEFVRQLLPLPKIYTEVIVCDPIQSSSKEDSRGGNSGHKSGTDGAQQKQGLQISKKERVSPWDILEGHKNPAPLNLSWFGAVRLDRKPMKYEEQQRLLLYHTHAMKKPASYFLEPIPLPAENLDPPAEKVDVKPPDPQLVLIADKQPPVAAAAAAALPPADIKMPATPGGSRKRGGGRSAARRQSAGPTPPAAAAAPIPSGIPSAIAASANMPPAANMPAPATGRISTQAFTGPGPYMQPGAPGGMPMVQSEMYQLHPGMAQTWRTYNPYQQSQQITGVGRGGYQGSGARDAIRNTVMTAPRLRQPHGAVSNQNWSTSPVRVPGGPGLMNRMPSTTGPRAAISFDQPQYVQQQSGMFQNANAQGIVQGGNYGVYGGGQTSAAIEQNQQQQQQIAQSFGTGAPAYQGGSAPGSAVSGNAGGGANAAINTGGGGNTMSAIQQGQHVGQQAMGYMTASQPGGSGQQQSAGTFSNPNSSRFGHMSGTIGAAGGMVGPGVMGSAAGNTGGPHQLPPGYNQQSLSRQMSGGGPGHQQPQATAAAVAAASNMNYLQQQQRRQAAMQHLQQQQQQLQQHQQQQQQHGGVHPGSVPQQTNAAGLMLQRQMSGAGVVPGNPGQQSQQNQYNQYHQFQ